MTRRTLRPTVGASFALAATLAATFAAAPPALAHDQAPAPAQRGPVLLRGGELHTVSGGVLAGHDLLFDGGRIVAIGRALEPPAGARVIELAGARVYPGLIALQTTLGLVEISAARATVDTTESGDSTPEVAAHVAWNPDSELLPTVRAHGITTVQSTPTSERARGLFAGRSFVVHLDGWNKEDAGLRLAWGQQLRFPAAGVRSGWGAPPAKEQKERAAQERLALERELDQAEAYLQARGGEPEGGAGQVDLRRAALAPIVTGEEPLFVLADDGREIGQALDFAERRGLSIVIVGGAEADLHAERLAARQVPVVLGNTHRLPFRADSDWDAPYTLAARLHAAGVRIAFAMPGASWDVRNLPFQAGHAIAYGLPAEAALAALTLVPAEIAGVAHRMGSLEVGKEATLVVSRGDLLDPLTQRVTHLFITGREIDLDHRHKRLERKYRQRLPEGAR